MKLTKRQKKIFLISTILFFLALAIVISSVLIANRNKGENNSPAPSKNIPPQDNSNLAKVKTEMVNFLEKKINSDNIKKDDLLKELKDKNYLNAGETDWKKYFDKASNSQELKIRKEQLLTIIDKLKNGPNPNPSPGPNPNPSPGPNPNPSPTPPTNKWEKVLGEIKSFINGNPSSSQEVKDWIQNKNYNPLSGVNLAGVGIEELKKISDSGPVSGLDQVPETVKYKEYVQLPAAGDGNCFLHSFSVFLTGQSDIDLTLRLRVALCLELMTNPEKYFSGLTNDKSKIQAVKNEISKERIAENTRWLSSDITKYLAHVLKRPIVSIIKSKFLAPFQVYDYPNSETGEGSDFTPTYSEKWVVYNSGGHFQPLIKK
ncbi:MAG: hypothetical protein I3273_07770 [Candidatus Moeniiplasma glomeromycotorum]|nr:hypothetical protein [Candidatus Moeniiplasma glomeromycotorum]MCE8169977.1 hypothetical protein [Candidatus Moeniiplasma glomeromycotorum]